MEKNRKENKERITKYGEFIASFFSWISPDKQKNRANELENLSKKNKNDK